MFYGIRTFADCMHLASFILIIYKLWKTKNCKGVSLKTQEVYLCVFLSRYIDLFFSFYSFYNTIMKIIFISFTLLIIYLMRQKQPICSTYNPDDDNLPHKYIYLFSFIMAIFIHRGSLFDFFEFLWSFSQWLESMAIIPQINVLQTNKSADSFTFHYIATLGSYRFIYILWWIYKYSVDGSYCFTTIIAGVVQVVLYLDFYYIYFKNYKAMLKETTELPVSN